jgi:hypothetical protein
LCSPWLKSKTPTSFKPLKQIKWKLRVKWTPIKTCQFRWWLVKKDNLFKLWHQILPLIITSKFRFSRWCSRWSSNNRVILFNPIKWEHKKIFQKINIILTKFPNSRNFKILINWLIIRKFQALKIHLLVL